MARQSNFNFLEECLRSSSGSTKSAAAQYYSSAPSTSSSARAIIQAWADLRDSLQNKSFHSNHIQSLKVLLSFQSSLHVADPQAKLILSILSSPNLTLLSESYPLFLRLLYIWVRKSLRPSAELIHLAFEIVPTLFSTEFCSEKNPFFFAEGVLLLGALTFLPSAPEKSKIVCLDVLCRLLEDEYRLVSSLEGIIPEILAGIGYALSSSVIDHHVRVLDSLLGVWGKEEGPHGNVYHGLMILHLTEWSVSNLMSSNSLEKIQIFIQEVLENPKASYVPFALVMAAGGVLRACNRFANSSQSYEIVSRLRICSENLIDSVAGDLNSKSVDDPITSLLLQCIALASARSGSISSRAPLFLPLASSLLNKVFPLRHLYQKILDFSPDGSALLIHEINEHLNSITFKEAGAITGVFCSQYISVDETSKGIVENIVWDYCRDIYSGHRQVALLLRGRDDQLLMDIEKIAESAFLMVVLFALGVSKKRLNSKSSQESRLETSVRILVSFSCLEYFRRIQLPEYMDTIRKAVVSVQENESACVSLIESIPSYDELTNSQDFSGKPKMEYVWSQDEVQTARILFYLRVIPTCIECLPIPVFRTILAPTMFLYMVHPNKKVARSSHTLLATFISSGRDPDPDPDQDKRELLKEQLVFYYVQKSLENYPGVTPFEGMASGVVAVARHLPAGSPATFYCVHSLIKKANTLCAEASPEKPDVWKNWQGELEACKKTLELLLRLVSLVDVLVLPELLKLLAQLIVQLPKDGQNLVLDELYSLVAESDDVTRKPTLVSWLQSLSYICSQAGRISKEEERISPLNTDSPSSDRLNARL